MRRVGVKERKTQPLLQVAKWVMEAEKAAEAQITEVARVVQQVTAEMAVTVHIATHNQVLRLAVVAAVQHTTLISRDHMEVVV